MESTTFPYLLFVPALMLSHHYKCTYFQLPDCSSQPSVLCHACFCLRFSLQRALPQKVLPPPIIKFLHLSIKKQKTQQQNEPFRLSLWNTSQPSNISSDLCELTPIFNRLLVHDLSIVHDSPSFACCLSYTQSYTPPLCCLARQQSCPVVDSRHPQAPILSLH